MKKSKSAEEMLETISMILEEEGNPINQKNLAGVELIESYILPGLENSKNTLSSLYKFQPASKKGFLGKIKYAILIRLRNIVFNVVEKQSMRQQKFNELTFKAIQELVRENKELKTKLTK